MNLRSAVAAINREGALLVYPIHNRKEPPSLWSHSIRERKCVGNGIMTVIPASPTSGTLQELASSRKVVYTKWFPG